MLKKFYPYEHVKSVFDIDYEKLYQQGFRGLVFDIDNTLVHHGDNSNQKIDNLFSYIKKIGFKTLLLTNNDEPRVQRFIENIDTPYICDANKPEKSCYINAVKSLNISKEKIICIGDQIFTDILGANRCDIPNILVDFIRLPDERKFGKRRFVEKMILKTYKISAYRHRLGDIVANNI
ncbi:MAG: YqeG family HAD IIIA-type phosphatase [Ruminococcus sp.]|nr:YqeG family HAD IIIA-type phosphatase [Ruminococcus sp.]